MGIFIERYQSTNVSRCKLIVLLYLLSGHHYSASGIRVCFMIRNLRVLEILSYYFDHPLIQVSLPLECQYSLNRRMDYTVSDIYCLSEVTIEKIKQLDVPMNYMHPSCRHGN
jgi:hypothetical protein